MVYVTAVPSDAAKPSVPSQQAWWITCPGCPTDQDQPTSISGNAAIARPPDITINLPGGEGGQRMSGWKLSPVRTRPDAGTDPPPRGRPSANRSTTVITGAASDDNHGHSDLCWVCSSPCHFVDSIWLGGGRVTRKRAVPTTPTRKLGMAP